MAGLLSKEASAIDNGRVQERLAENVASANVLFFEATYVCGANDTTEEASNTIGVCDLPVGAIVLPELCRIANEASMGGETLAVTKIGDAADDDRYSATSFSINASTAGQALITPNIAAGIITRTPVTAATKRIIATFTTASAPTAGKKIKFIIAYRPRG